MERREERFPPRSSTHGGGGGSSSNSGPAADGIAAPLAPPPPLPPDGFLVFCVEDTGIGLSADTLEVIFEVRSHCQCASVVLFPTADACMANAHIPCSLDAR